MFNVTRINPDTFKPTTSIHLTVPREISLHEAKNLVDELKAALADDYPKPPFITKPDPQAAKLKDFLMQNFKSETGDETPIDCAIRLLTKKAKK